MGLFSKKEVCPICGKKIKGDVLIKIKDNVALCKECSAMVNMDTAMIPYQTVEDMRAHIKYRQENLGKYEAFESTLDLKAGSAIFRVDESEKIWYCTKNKRDKNPPVFTYDEIDGFEYTENGEPYVPEEKKSGLGALFNKKEPVQIRSMKLHITLTNRYTPTIDIEMMSLNDEIKSNSLAYKSNKKAIDRVIEALTGMKNNSLLGDIAAEDEAAEEAVAEAMPEKSFAEGGSEGASPEIIPDGGSLEPPAEEFAPEETAAEGSPDVIAAETNPDAGESEM